jgi:hypothetical protein
VCTRSRGHRANLPRTAATHGFDRQEQHPAVRWKLDELGIDEIEALRRLVRGLHQHRGDADALRGGGDAAQGVGEDVRAQAVA